MLQHCYNAYPLAPPCCCNSKWHLPYIGLLVERSDIGVELGPPGRGDHFPRFDGGWGEDSHCRVVGLELFYLHLLFFVVIDFLSIFNYLPYLKYQLKYLKL
jgi:hypothetical protein